MDSGTSFMMRRSARLAEAGSARHDDQDRAVIAGPILVAVDISWDSRGALLWACRHAARINVPVTVLHVLHDPAEAPGKYNGEASDPLMPMADTAEKMLSEFMSELRENYPELKQLAEAPTKVVKGLPAGRIVDEAVRLDATLIVVGSRGHRGLPGLMYASTAQKVVRLSPIPVTVVKDQRR